MRRDFDVVGCGEPVEAVLPKLSAAGGHAVVVTDDGVVVGMLTAQSVADLIMVDRAMHARPN
jgi:hypothetical protein